MARKRSNLGRGTRGIEAVRRVIANQTEEERTMASEQNKQRITQILGPEEGPKQPSAKLQEARLKARRSRHSVSDLHRSQQNNRDRSKVAEKCTQQAKNGQTPLYVPSRDRNHEAMNNYSGKYQPHEALQRRRVCSEKIIEQDLRSNNFYRTSERKKNGSVCEENGILGGSEKDVCDCLIDGCPGCHFPCPKCRSYKCGCDCRLNRKWVYESVENEGDIVEKLSRTTKDSSSVHS